MMDEQIVIRSYRQVFRLRRRIYRVDRWAIPVPGGVPLVGLAYFAAVLLGMLVLGALPLIGGLVELVPAQIRHVLIPLAVAVLACQTAPDGRRVDRFVRSWIGFRLRALRRSRAGDEVPFSGRLWVAHDHRRARVSRARVRGPVRVTTTFPARLETSLTGKAVIRPCSEGEPVQVELAAGEVLEVRR